MQLPLSCYAPAVPAAFAFLAARGPRRLRRRRARATVPEALPGPCARRHVGLRWARSTMPVVVVVEIATDRTGGAA